MNNILVRFIAENDVDSVARLFDQYRQFYEQKEDLSLAKKFISDRYANKESIIFVAELNQELVGFCQLYPSFCSLVAAQIYVLYDLYVQPQYRSHGIARKLLLEAESLAKREGIHHLDLTTAKSNVNAQALYASLGWEKDNSFDLYSKKIIA